MIGSNSFSLCVNPLHRCLTDVLNPASLIGGIIWAKKQKGLYHSKVQTFNFLGNGLSMRGRAFPEKGWIKLTILILAGYNKQNNKKEKDQFSLRVVTEMILCEISLIHYIIKYLVFIEYFSRDIFSHIRFLAVLGPRPAILRLFLSQWWSWTTCDADDSSKVGQMQSWTYSIFWCDCW